MLTLQVIGEAILSLSAEESDRVFPHLYLPIMEEGNRRSLEPWRSYLPTPAWFRQRRNVRKLNAYIGGARRVPLLGAAPSLRPHPAPGGMLQARWKKRLAGETPVRPH